jgi:hypothetical protein
MSTRYPVSRSTGRKSVLPLGALPQPDPTRWSQLLSAAVHVSISSERLFSQDRRSPRSGLYGLTEYLSISVAADGITVKVISGPLVADVGLAVLRRGYFQDQGTAVGSRASDDMVGRSRLRYKRTQRPAAQIEGKGAASDDVDHTTCARRSSDKDRNCRYACALHHA